MSKRVTITIDNIDIDLLREQKASLVAIIFEEREACKDMNAADRESTEKKLEDLDGLLNLLDAIDDKALETDEGPLPLIVPGALLADIEDIDGALDRFQELQIDAMLEQVDKDSDEEMRRMEAEQGNRDAEFYGANEEDK